jgi:hypothetical protein
MTEIELGTAEKENFQTPCTALAQHPRTTSLPMATCLYEDFAVSGQIGDESSLLYCMTGELTGSSTTPISHSEQVSLPEHHRA